MVIHDRARSDAGFNDGWEVGRMSIERVVVAIRGVELDLKRRWHADSRLPALLIISIR